MEADIKKLRQDVKLLTRDLKGELGSKRKQKMKELYEKYRFLTSTKRRSTQN